MSFNQIAVPVLALMVSLLIYAEIRKINRLIYFFKPLSTLLVIMIAAVGFFGSSTGNAESYGLLVLIGLLLSLGGDLALMPPDKPGKFRFGLILFLSAHIVYIAAFWGYADWAFPDFLIGLGLLVFATGYFLLMRPNLGTMKIPVIAYILIISLMLSRALSTLFAGGIDPARARMIALGAALFFISDVILSAHRFWKPWRYNRFSLVFYFGGQLAIALSAA